MQQFGFVNQMLLVMIFVPLEPGHRRQYIDNIQALSYLPDGIDQVK